VTRLRFVEQEKARYPVRILCTALGVSPSGYYAWRSRGPSARERSDAALAAEIRQFHARSRGTYGARRIHAELVLGHGVLVGRCAVELLMMRAGLAGLSGRPRFRRLPHVAGRAWPEGRSGPAFPAVSPRPAPTGRR